MSDLKNKLNKIMADIEKNMKDKAARPRLHRLPHFGIPPRRRLYPLRRYPQHPARPRMLSPSGQGLHFIRRDCPGLLHALPHLRPSGQHPAGQLLPRHGAHGLSRQRLRQPHPRQRILQGTPPSPASRRGRLRGDVLPLRRRTLFSFGGAMFGCEHCGNLKFVPFRCKSRFCPSCGTKYAIDRTTAMSFKLVNCIHRHCVFTIDEQLRIFFYEDRSLLNCLFSAVRSTLLRLFHNLNQTADKPSFQTDSRVVFL